MNGDRAFTCGGGDGSPACVYYRERHTPEDAARRAEARGQPVPPGMCSRYPSSIERHPEDGCGEHSELRRLERGDLAAQVAVAVAEQLAGQLGQPVTISAASVDAEQQNTEQQAAGDA